MNLSHKVNNYLIPNLLMPDLKEVYDYKARKMLISGNKIFIM